MSRSRDKAPHGEYRRANIINAVLKRVRMSEREAEDELLGPCWIWTGPCSGNGRGGGYPRMKLNGHTVAVHRVTYTHAYGYIPGKKTIDHLCRRRRCVNPAHLELVTHRMNCRRRDMANGKEDKA